MSGPNLRRGLAASAAMSLVALTLLVAPVSAGNTRLIYIGNPPPGPTDRWTQDNGFLTNQTQTHPGGLTAVVVEVANDGGQTVNHASLLGGDAADSAAINCLFPPPGLSTTDCESGTGAADPSLGPGLTFAAAYTNDGTCVQSATSLDCDLGSFAGGQAKYVTVVFQTSDLDTGAGPQDGTFNYWLGAYLAETNSTGSNQDNFYAQGSVSTTSATCDANTDANYFLAGSNVDLSTLDCSSSGGTTNASILSGDVLGVHGFGSLTIGGDGTTACAATPYSCYGDGVVADVIGGSPVPGGLQWTITWYGTRSISGVIHFWDTYDPTTNPNDYTVISFDKQSQCPTDTSVDCWVTTSKSKGNADPTWFNAVIRTGDNGLSFGFN